MNETLKVREALSCCTPGPGNSRDMASSKVAWLLWALPFALIAAGVFWHVNPVWLWTPAFLVAGLACLANARRCGRRHCFFTGPLFLLAALASVLMGTRVIAVHWNWIIIAVLAGSGFAFGLECVQGRYVTKP
ncbi:MAG: hypothetical protein ACRD3T_21400 [Terriglobia bacterium]